MLWTITVILFVLWLVGFIGFHVLGAWIHLLLLIVVVMIVLNLLSGRRAV
ncbi:MAG: lmo0937 family membrane protein [Acidobacteriaceae bacterium]